MAVPTQTIRELDQLPLNSTLIAPRTKHDRIRENLSWRLFRLARWEATADQQFSADEGKRLLGIFPTRASVRSLEDVVPVTDVMNPARSVGVDVV